MSAVSELIRAEADGGLSFGDYTLPSKAKLDIDHAGSKYKIKTFREITKLEKDGMFAYESVPGTAVTNLHATASGLDFQVEGPEDADITLGLDEGASYEVRVGGGEPSTVTTGLGGKLTISVELGDGPVPVSVVKK